MSTGSHIEMNGDPYVIINIKASTTGRRSVTTGLMLTLKNMVSGKEHTQRVMHSFKSSPLRVVSNTLDVTYFCKETNSVTLLNNKKEEEHVVSNKDIIKMLSETTARYEVTKLELYGKNSKYVIIYDCSEIKGTKKIH